MERKQVLVKLLSRRKFQIWTYFLNASAGHWKRCGGPHSAHGPLFAHPCPKSWLSRLAASAVLASGQPSQKTRKDLRDQPIDGESYVLSGILILIESVLFSNLVNSMQNQARSTSWASAIDRSIAIDLLATRVVG